MYTITSHDVPRKSHSLVHEHPLCTYQTSHLFRWLSRCQVAKRCAEISGGSFRVDSSSFEWMAFMNMNELLDGAPKIAFSCLRNGLKKSVRSLPEIHRIQAISHDVTPGFINHG